MKAATKKIAYTITTKGNYVKIFINGLLHFSIKYNDIISIQTWIMSNGWYCIEYYVKGKEESILSEYDDFEKWSAIVKLLNENIK
jgi:hypothetical protein